MNEDTQTGEAELHALLSQIEAGAADRDAVMAAVARFLAENRTIPLALEHAALTQHLIDDPSREDLQRRLVTVSRRLGKPVDSALVEKTGAAYLEEEYATDFQAMLADYGRRVAFADLEPIFKDFYAQVRKYTMTTIERQYALWTSIGYLIRAGVPGDIVECGVWRGGSMMLAALECARLGATDRRLWLFDTFAGLPKPEAVDVDVLGNRAIDGWEALTLPDGRTIWAYADEAEVRANMARTGYPEASVRYVRGMVEDTVPAQAPERIALLRIDTDWYASYRHILAHLYDRVAPGGIVIFDDYGHLNGARIAVDEFLRERRVFSPLLRVDYSCRLLIKV